MGSIRDQKLEAWRVMKLLLRSRQRNVDEKMNDKLDMGLVEKLLAAGAMARVVASGMRPG